MSNPATLQRRELGFRRWAAQLLDTELWCLGYDIRHEEGNRLTRLGFCAFRQSSGSTRYEARLDDETALVLWGFGIMITHTELGALFLRRYDFAPRWTPLYQPPRVHRPSELPALRVPYSGKELAVCRQLLPRLLLWIADYEHWIAEHAGRPYRQRSLDARGEPSLFSAANLAASWEIAAKKCRQQSPRLAAASGYTPWDATLRQLHRPVSPTARPTPPYSRVVQ
ncbi:MAG: hypothetical protein ACRCZF_11085 [Gemmataceae bacterium]